MDMEREMEMRAREDIGIGQDITPPIPPLSSVLYDSFRLSHCSSCFSPLPPSPHQFPPLFPTFPNNQHTPFLLYCSPQCSAADSNLHLFSAELHLLQSRPPLDTSDLRLALRLLHSLSSPSNSRRLAGLLTNHEKFTTARENSDDEVLDGIWEGAKAMAMATRIRDGVEVPWEANHAVLEESVLCLVLTNAVEVQDSSGRSLGIAVYDTDFSWINHSCSPNASYRFLVPSSETPPFCRRSMLRIVPAGEETQETDNVVCSNGEIIEGGEGYGPSIIVRSIKRIKKGEEVTVAYTDLLQPKAMRQSELWLKYRFICCCQRCSALSPPYVDHVLQEISETSLVSSNLSSDDDVYRASATKMCSDYIDDAITEYLSVGDPESCCKKLENILIHGLLDEHVETKEGKSQLKFWLQPLHQLSLKIYTTLASAYKIRAIDLLALHSEMDMHQLESFDMSKTSAAYSLLLAGATHNLFCSEPSLIASVANHWINAGESLITLSRSSIGFPVSNPHSLAEYICLKCSLMDKFEAKAFCSPGKSADFEVICREFLDCFSNITPKVWRFLIHGSHYLEVFKDPINFSWLVAIRSSNIWDCLAQIGGTGSYCWTESSISGSEAEGCMNQVRKDIFELGVHCLVYGGLLSNICYGHNSHLSCIRNLIYCGRDLVSCVNKEN